MSQGNVELVRSIYAAWHAGDWSSTEWASPQIEYVIADGPAPGRWTGLEGLKEGWRSVLSAWQDLRSEPEKFCALDSERVLVLQAWAGRGKASGVDLARMQTKQAALYHVRHGQVTRIVHYWDRERALADLGLSEQDAHTDS